MLPVCSRGGECKVSSMVRPVTYFDLIDAFPEPGCAVCRLLQRNAARSLDSLLYEYVTDPDTQQAFRKRRGLCNEHSWQMLRHTGNALGIATLIGASLDEVLHVLTQTPLGVDPQSGLGRLLSAGSKHNLSGLADQLEPTGACLICSQLSDAEGQYIHVFCQSLDDEALARAFAASDGLCLPHLRQALRCVPDAKRGEKLLTMQVEKWQELRAQLQEFREKNDYRRSGEPMGVEGDSWRRAIRRLAGEEGVFGLDPRSS